MAKIDFPQYA